MVGTRFPLLALLSLATCGGCTSLARPPLFDPGPADIQQARAIRFDPYPSPDIGPPVEGGRPLDYSRPLTEPKFIQSNPQIPAYRRRAVGR